VGIGVGVGIAAYLCALLASLLWADAWAFSWWPIGAAALGVVAIVAAVLAGWLLPTRLARTRVRLGRAGVPIALLLLTLAAVPAVAAASLGAPRAEPLDERVVQLAVDHRAEAPLPPRLLELRRRAERLQASAGTARDDASAADNDVSALLASQARADTAMSRAERAIARWSDELEVAQAEYDDFQSLLDDSYEDLDLDDELYDLDLDELDDLDYDDVRGLSPTTEDFGSGSGSVGQCADGTYSDSIGRPGACSHHGGVAP
jgi:hypothetical protein